MLQHLVGFVHVGWMARWGVTILNVRANLTYLGFFHLFLFFHELSVLVVDEDVEAGEDGGQDEEEKQPQVNQLEVLSGGKICPHSAMDKAFACHKGVRTWVLPKIFSILKK